MPELLVEQPDRAIPSMGAKSLQDKNFRLGFDHLHHILLNPSPLHQDDFRQTLQLLSCP